MPSAFQNRTPNINGNEQLRSRSARLVDFAPEITDKPEGGIVLPGGCGKSGTIALRPSRFARPTRCSGKTPPLAKQLVRDVDRSGNSHFYAVRASLIGMKVLTAHGMMRPRQCSAFFPK